MKMSSSKESTSKTSDGREPPTRYNSESNDLDSLIDEIDKFLNEYTCDGNELSSNTNATESFEELNNELKKINANHLKNVFYKPLLDNSMDINQNDLNEISQIWNQPEINFQQKNKNQALQIENFKKRNENIQIPIENPDSSTEHIVYYNDPVKSDIITNAGRRWNRNYKQNNYLGAGHIQPKFRNKKNKNNYKQSAGSYRNTQPKRNVFKRNLKKPFYKTPQENYSSCSAPTHRLCGFNVHSNKFHSNNLTQKPNKIFQGINQFDPYMPFKRNNKELNKYNGINDSQNDTISQYESNMNEKSFHNFQLSSFNQPDFNNEIQNQLSEDSPFRSKHEQNLYTKNNVSVLPNWSDSYDHLNNNNMEMPKSDKPYKYNQYTTKTNINIQNRKKKSYNQYSINNSFEVLNVNGKDPLNLFSTSQNIRIENSDECEPYNQYSSNNSTEIQITSKNDLSKQFSTNQSVEIKKRSECDKPSNYCPAKKNIEMQKWNKNETYNQNSKNKNLKTEENDEKSHLSLSTTKNNKNKIRIGIEEYKYYADNKTDINIYKSMQVEPYNDFLIKENEITPNNETAEDTVDTLVDSKESLDHDGCKYTASMSLQECHCLIEDYLSPESLVGCTIKLSSRKLANAGIKDKLNTAFRVHGALLNSWWTSDDMFFVTYIERNVAQSVYYMYPKNTSSSY